ncbi:MAG: cell division protein FtsZ [Rickettsiales bacterium]|jgi:cell division protein FtsZ|nr:cell division protein FtsZ [Rickettsiales bacterium]
MTINLHLPTKNEILRPTITVVGVGGAGGNAVNNMIAANLEGVNFVVANTDAQALDHSLTDRTIQLGAGITKGLGAGAKPEVGRAAAEEAREEIAAHIEGSNMVFITAGMGGGTGTGAAAVVARIAKEQGVLTVGVVTKPFQFEGSHRMKLAEAGLKELQDYVDTLIVIPNQNLFRIANERTTFSDAFKMADEVLHSGVRGVTDLMVKPGLINLDFADIRTVMQEMGKAMMGTGEATGERRAVEAAEAAISNPLLDDVSLKGARALLINITGGSDMTLFEVDEAANRIREEVDPEANIIFGSTFGDDMQGRMRVSVVATGIDAQSMSQHTPQKQNVFNEPKRPYSFASSAKVEPTKSVQPVVRAASFEAPQRELPKPAQVAAEQRMPSPVRMERQEEPAVRQEPARQQVAERETEQAPMPQRLSEFRAEERAPQPQNATPDLFAPQSVAPSSYAPHREPQRELPIRDEQQSSRGFLQRALDVGRAFSAKPQDAVERVQVVQRGGVAEAAQRKPEQSQEEQYLDIPAFLRRQAN